MQMKTLGRTRPLAVPAIGLGCMGMTPIYGTPDPASAIETIRRAADLGAGFLDTSDAYANGANEELVGRAIEGIRDRVIVATKFGNVRMPDGKPGANGKPEYVVEACEKSLKRLGIDVIDLYYQHRVDPSVPIEETIGAMSKLVAQGKVRYLGLSEAGAATIRRAHKVHPITTLQTEYSLFTRDVEPEILPTCRELGIGFVAYSPLQRGTLSGTIEGPQSLANNDRRHDHPRFQGDNLLNNVRLLGPIKALAEKTGATPAQVALAWVLSRGPDVVPIPGTSKIARLEENLATLDKALSKADLDALSDSIDASSVAGTRYPGGQMGTIGI